MSFMFPDGKSFAFTILDDTDDSRTGNVAPVYALLRDLGLRTTKTAWPLEQPEGDSIYWNADTLQDSEYCEFVRQLAAEGFEIAWHNATMETSAREQTVRGLDYFRRALGVDPQLHCNHGQNRENIYWGASRYRMFPTRPLMRLLSRFGDNAAYEGHVEGSPYFWGDICRQQFRFVRSFAFSKLDISDIPPGRPYRVDSTPFVNYWFVTADAANVQSFTKLVTPASIDRLAERGGYTIVSTHLGKGFCRDGQLDAGFRHAIEHLSRLGGWYVPVSQLLEHLLTRDHTDSISSGQLRRLEWRHFSDRLLGRILKREGVGDG